MRSNIAYCKKFHGTKECKDAPPSTQLQFSLSRFVPLNCRIDESQDKDELKLYRGQFTISLDRARKGISYKYVVVKKGKVHWEQLPEFQPTYDQNIALNRFLKIPDKQIEQGGK